MRDRIEVVRRDAAGDEIEARVIERQRLGLGEGDAHIRKPAPLRFALHLVEHFVGDIGRPYPRDVRREGIGDMAAAGCDIEHAPRLLRRGEGDQPSRLLPCPCGLWVR